MSLPTQHEISGKVAYKGRAQISVYPVSKGTWTVQVFFGKKSKRFTGLSDHFEVVGAVNEAQDWLDEQSAD